MELYQMNKLLPSQGNSKVKQQPMEWRKIFALLTFNKGLITEIVKKNQTTK